MLPGHEVRGWALNLLRAAALRELLELARVLNVMSSAGASVLGFGYLLPVLYLLWSLKYGEVAGPNPWGASGLEWETASPPPTENFAVTPRVTTDPYEFTPHVPREMKVV